MPHGLNNTPNSSRQIKKYWVFYVIFISAISILGGSAYLNRVAIKEFDPVTPIFTATDYSEMLLVRYDGFFLQYYYRGNNPDRLNIILKTMKKLTVSLRHKLLKGDYIFSLHDGVHYKYPWPVLGFAGTDKLINNSDVILIPDPDALLGYSNLFREVDKAIYDTPWSNKIAKVFWRGSATGAGPENNDLSGTARLRFMNYASKLYFTDVGLTFYTQQLNPNFKKLLSSVYSIKPRVTVTEAIKYKYLIDIDGNSCSYSRMAWILYSNSLLMKHASIYKQWYYDQMQPYVHYIPISENFNNLQEQYIWTETNQESAQTIAENGRIFAKHIFNENKLLDSFEQGLLQYHALINLYPRTYAHSPTTLH